MSDGAFLHARDPISEPPFAIRRNGKGVPAAGLQWCVELRNDGVVDAIRARTKLRPQPRHAFHRKTGIIVCVVYLT